MPPITSPFQGKLDVDLTNFAIEHRNRGYMSELIAPLVPVAKQSDKYVVFGPEGFKDPGNIIRGPAAAAIELVQSLSRDIYICEDHAASRIVALEEVSALAGVRDPFEWATRMLLDRVIFLKRELELIALVTAGAQYNSSNQMTLVGTSKWSDTSGVSDPIRDVLQMAKAVALGSGVDLAEMQMVIGWTTMRDLKNHPDIKDRLVHTRGGAVTLRDISDVFEMPVNLSSARQEIGDALQFLWPDTVWIGYVNPTPNREDVSFAKTFLFSGAPDTVGGVGVERSPVFPASRKAESVDVHYWHSDAMVTTKDAGAIIIDTN